MFCTVVAEATEAVCCQSMETNVSNAARVDMARPTCETGREGKGLTSRVESLLSSSSCPGKVERRIAVRQARKMAAMLKVFN